MAAEHEQKMEARKRAEEIQRVADVALENLTAFDQDLESHGNNIGRLTKLRDELQDCVAQLGEDVGKRVGYANITTAYTQDTCE